MARDEPPSRSLRRRKPAYFNLVGLAASCFVGLLATDLAYWQTANMMWADFSAWLVTAGVVAGYVAIVVALIEVFALRSPRLRPTWLWAISNLVALILATFDMLVHTRDAWTSVVPWGVILSALVVLVILVAACMERPRYGIARAGVTP
jgi:uncharacterized membrane protein